MSWEVLLRGSSCPSCFNLVCGGRHRSQDRDGAGVIQRAWERLRVLSSPAFWSGRIGPEGGCPWLPPSTFFGAPCERERDWGEKRQERHARCGAKSTFFGGNAFHRPRGRGRYKAMCEVVAQASPPAMVRRAPVRRGYPRIPMRPRSLPRALSRIRLRTRPRIRLRVRPRLRRRAWARARVRKRTRQRERIISGTGTDKVTDTEGR